jgi:hypothetical protein
VKGRRSGGVSDPIVVSGRDEGKQLVRPLV